MISKNIFKICLAQTLRKSQIYRQIWWGTVKWAIHEMNTADLYFIRDFQKYINTLNSSNNKKVWNIFRKGLFLTFQHRQTAALPLKDRQKLFIISSQIIYPSFGISKNIFNVSLALKLWKLSLKMETAGLLIHRQKRRVTSKTL